jgi:PAS domain S-box-containing protein
LWFSVLAALIFALVRWLVLRPVERAAAWASDPNPPSRALPLTLERPTGRSPDEIDRLVTALNASAADVRKSQLQVRLAATAFEHASEGIMITDEATRIVAVNQRFVEAFGYSPTEIVGKTPHVLNSKRQSAAFYQEMWRRIGERGNWVGEIWNRRKDGRTAPMWLSLSAVRDTGGAVSHYIAMYYDLSARYAVEETLRESQAELSLIVDNAPAVIAYLDSGLRCRFVNRSFEELFCVSKAQANGRHLREIVDRPLYEGVESKLHWAKAERLASDEYPQSVPGGGVRRLKVYLVPHLNEWGKRLGCYLMAPIAKSSSIASRSAPRRSKRRTASWRPFPIPYPTTCALHCGTLRASFTCCANCRSFSWTQPLKRLRTAPKPPPSGST